MISVLYDSMAIPDSCQLGKRVFKKLFHENAKLGVTDKKAFREDIDTVTWQFTLKPNTIAVRTYEDGQREYHEIALLQVDLKTQKRTGRIAEVMHRAIPYPLVIVFTFGAMCAISLAHKRFSQAEKGAIVAEEYALTDWLDLAAPTPSQRAFLGSLAVTSLPHTHFFAFYSALMDRVVALDCARLTGQFRIDLANAAEGRERRRQRLTESHEIETRISGARAAAKRESQVNRLVDLNLEIKRLNARLAELATML